MKATTFLALIFGVMLGVGGTFAGLYATNSFGAEDTSPQIAKAQPEEKPETDEKEIVKIDKPVLLPEVENTDKSPEDAISNKPEDTDILEPEVSQPAVDVENSEADTDISKAIPMVPSEKEKEMEAIKKALEKAMEGIEGGGKIVDFEDLLGGPKVDLNATIAGTVIDSNGIPISNAKIYANYSEEASSGGTMSIAISRSFEGDNAGSPIATTDGSGNWTAAISRKVGEKAKLRVSLTAKADNFADSKNKSVTVKDGDAKEGIQLTLRGAGSVSGYVRDEQGGGVEGVTVSLSKGSSGGFGGRYVMFGGGSNMSAKTDSAGFYKIENVPEGEYSFNLKADGAREISGPKEVKIKVGVETSAPVEFVVAKTTALRFKVVDEEGKPVLGYVTVNVEGSDGKSEKTLSGRLDADGQVTLNNPPVGSFNVSFTIWGFEKATVFCDFREGQTYDAGTITLKKSDKAPEIPGGIILPE